MTTPTLQPAIFLKNLWDQDDNLGATLDAVFINPEIRGISIGYHLTTDAIFAVGPALVITHRDKTPSDAFQEEGYKFSPTLPQDDTDAAAIGRAIQGTLNTEYASDFILTHWEDEDRGSWSGYITAVFTRNTLLLFKDDPWEVVNTNPLDTYLDAAAMQICTMVVRPAQSAHERLARISGAVTDFGIYLENQKEGLEILEAQGVARLLPVTAAQVSRLL